VPRALHKIAFSEGTFCAARIFAQKLSDTAVMVCRDGAPRKVVSMTALYPNGMARSKFKSRARFDRDLKRNC
jgi:hypothetical protein